MIEQGDCLEMMRALDDASVDLIATDPPYYTGKEWRGSAGEFSDRWASRDAFLDYMRERAVEMRRVLKPTGALYWQCDPNISPWLRLMLDEVLGEDKYVTDIFWKRTQSGHCQSKSWGRVVDAILLYGRADIDPGVRSGELTEGYRRRFRHQDSHGLYDRVSIVTPVVGEAASVPWGGYDPADDGAVWRLPATLPEWVDAPGWRKKSIPERLDIMEEHGLIEWPAGCRRPRRKAYLSECRGAPPTNLWEDIPVLQSGQGERVGYPTQKPVALYERIILASSKPGDMVLDPFCGSGTTLVAAVRHGREFRGCDISHDAVRAANLRVAAEQGALI